MVVTIDCRDTINCKVYHTLGYDLYVQLNFQSLQKPSTRHEEFGACIRILFPEPPEKNRKQIRVWIQKQIYQFLSIWDICDYIAAEKQRK